MEYLCNRMYIKINILIKFCKHLNFLLGAFVKFKPAAYTPVSGQFTRADLMS
jgi:hypothetical protein